MKPIYTGLFLGDTNHDLFRELAENVWKGGLMDNLYLHHMTIKFRPSPEDVEAVPIGGYIPVKLMGYTPIVSGKLAQAFTVMPMSLTKGLVRPHITVATAPGVPPKDSHEAIKEGVSLFSDDENEELLECPHMDEVVHKWHYLRCGWYDGKNVHYNKDELSW